MDEWLFWEQYSHEPYIAVCRFQMDIWASRPPISIRTRSSAAMRRWREWSISWPIRAFWSATRSLADVSLLAYTRSRMRAASTSTAMLRRWIGERWIGELEYGDRDALVP